MKTFSEYKINEELVQIPGYGRVSRAWARDKAIKTLRMLADAIEKDENVPVGYFDLAREAYKASVTPVVAPGIPE